MEEIYFEEILERIDDVYNYQWDIRKIQMRKILVSVYNQGARDNYQDAYDDGLKDGLYK
jgi:hypothetical protein